MPRKEDPILADGGRLEIRLLGPVEVVRDGRATPVGGPRIRTLLALLALHPGTTIPGTRLIDELWAGEPPDGAEVTLRSYVSRLRRALGEDAPITGGERGYAISLEPDQVDAHRFEQLARVGLRSLERRRHRHAIEALQRALALWRGEPFTDLPGEGAIRAEATRLVELRGHVLEARIDAELELGRAVELVDELEGLVAELPYRERLWRHLMVALYRAGRQADALAAYHRARAVLAEDLGLEPGPELRELESAILNQDVPPPAADGPVDEPRLPVPLSTFVGRRRELDAVTARLGAARLVTLVGVGGVGKTRLAIEAAQRTTPAFSDGAAFVDLSVITDPARLVSAIASSLGVSERPGEPLDRSLDAYLHDAELLLVLDNCEHLRATCAATSARLLGAAAGLRILATSREVLGVPGEVIYRVPPLEVPDVDAPDDEVRSSEAVRLLLERAAAMRPGLRIDAAAARMAARICRDLDGLPLAIELAAARMSALSLEEIADRIRDRFRFLVSWRRLASARHQTLREAMDWSFELLDPDERRILAGASIFDGTFDRPGIAAVLLDGDEDAALMHLERLVHASLVVPVEHGHATRYRLLETVREYAAAQLDAGEAAGLRRRHADHMLGVARSANLAAESASGPPDLETARTNLPGIRAAIGYAIDTDAALGLAIACELERFWITNAPREAIEILTTLLGIPELPESLRARGYRCRGGCRYYIGQFDEGVADYQQAMAIHERLGEEAAVAHLHLRLAIEAERRADTEEAQALLKLAARVPASSRFTPDAYVTELLLGDLASAAGRSDEALALFRSASELAAEAGDGWWQASILLQAASGALALGRVADAGPVARRALELSWQAGDRQGVIYALAVLAEEAARQGDGARAGMIWGALEAELERGGPLGQWELEHPAFESRVRDAAGPAFGAGYAGGRSLSLGAAVEEAQRPSG